MAMSPWINVITLGRRDVSAAKAFSEKRGSTLHPMNNENNELYDVSGVVLARDGYAAFAEEARVETSASSTFRSVSMAWSGAKEAQEDLIFHHALAWHERAEKAPEKVCWSGRSRYFAVPDEHLGTVAYNPFATLTGEGQLQLP